MKISKTLLGVMIAGVLLLGWQKGIKAEEGTAVKEVPAVATEAPAAVAAPAVATEAPAVVAAPAVATEAPAEAAPAVETEPAILTVAELYAKKAEIKGKIVTVFGNVVKVNLGVMGKNWIHLQDGTGTAGTNDITITTNGRPNIKDKVSVSGIVAIDKDFGGGYKYSVIIEEAIINVQ